MKGHDRRLQERERERFIGHFSCEMGLKNVLYLRSTWDSESGNTLSWPFSYDFSSSGRYDRQKSQGLRHGMYLTTDDASVIMNVEVDNIIAENTMRHTLVITKIVAYYRLSKPKKGKSKGETIRDAYGLEDQRREVAKFAAEHNAKIIAEFTEIESGTRKNVHREELEKAINMAKMHNATLVIGKQDRLARNVFLISGLMESGVHFVPVDRPDQSRLETHLRAVIDEEEAARISERTKRGLQIAREKGKLFGSARPNQWKGIEHLRGFKQATAASAKARHERCNQAYGFLIPIIRQLLDEGKKCGQIADELNKMGHVTTWGKPFHVMAVRRIIKRFEKVPT